MSGCPLLARAKVAQSEFRSNQIVPLFFIVFIAHEEIPSSHSRAVRLFTWSLLQVPLCH